MPRVHHQWYPDSLYYETYALNNDVVNALKNKGHSIGEIIGIGRAQGIIIDNKEKLFWGAADPRSYGMAVGY